MNSTMFASKLKHVCAMIQQIKAINNPDIIERAEYLLAQENTSLEQEIETAKEELRMLEMQFGMLQYKIPKAAVSCSTDKLNLERPLTTTERIGKVERAAAMPEAVSNGKPRNFDRVKATSKEAQSNASQVIDVGRLDFRVGRIVEVNKHPDADNLYVEKVDLGEGSPRTVISGLVNHVAMETLQNLVGVFLCNFKPAKMRGIESQAMLMCAVAPEAGGVEPLRIKGSETGVTLGEAVVVPGYEGTPDAQLNPKKKIFETVKPFLRVDQSGLATYKGVPWTLRGSPTTVVYAPTLRDVQIA